MGRDTAGGTDFANDKTAKEYLQDCAYLTESSWHCVRNSIENAKPRLGQNLEVSRENFDG